MSKHLFYDWFGYNHKLFHDMHHIVEDHVTIKILKMLSDYVGNYLMFPIHLVLLIVILTTFAKICNKSKDEKPIYIKTILVLCTSMALSLSLGYILKVFLEYSRPYCTHGTILNEIVRMINEYKHGSCYHSAPSGHSVYTTTFIFSIWPILNKYGKAISASILAIIMTSRVVLGFHFPADVFYGFLLAATTTLAVRKFGDKKLTNISKKIYNKYCS